MLQDTPEASLDPSLYSWVPKGTHRAQMCAPGSPRGFPRCPRGLTEHPGVLLGVQEYLQSSTTVGPSQFAPKAFAVHPAGCALPGVEGLKLQEHWFYPSQNAKQCKLSSPAAKLAGSESITRPSACLLRI